MINTTPEQDKQMLDFIQRAAQEREAELRAMAAQMERDVRSEARNWAHQQLERQIAAGQQQTPLEQAKEALQNTSGKTWKEKFMDGLPPHLDKAMKEHLAGMAVAEGGAARMRAEGKWDDQKMRDFQATVFEDTIKELSPEMYRRGREDGSLEKALELAAETGNRSLRESAEYRRGLVREVLKDSLDTANDQGIISDEAYVSALEQQRLLEPALMDHNGERIDNAETIAAELYAVRDLQRSGVPIDTPREQSMDDYVTRRQAENSYANLHPDEPLPREYRGVRIGDALVNGRLAERRANPQYARLGEVGEEAARAWRMDRKLKTGSDEERAQRRLQNAVDAAARTKEQAKAIKEEYFAAKDAVEGEIAAEAQSKITGNESHESYVQKRGVIDAAATLGKLAHQPPPATLGSILDKATGD
jgi:hypothetical protein